MTKKQVSTLYVEQLEELWQNVVNENLSMLAKDSNDGTLSEDILNQINSFRDAMFSSLTDQIDAISPVPTPIQPPSALPPVTIPPTSNAKLQLSKIKTYEEEHIDASYLNKLDQLKSELYTTIKKVEQLRKDVPSIVNTEVTQNLKKLQPPITTTTSSQSPINLEQFTSDMTEEQAKEMLDNLGVELSTIKSNSDDLAEMLIQEVSHSKEVIDAVSHIISQSSSDNY